MRRFLALGLSVVLGLGLLSGCGTVSDVSAEEGIEHITVESEVMDDAVVQEPVGLTFDDVLVHLSETQYDLNDASSVDWDYLAEACNVALDLVNLGLRDEYMFLRREFWSMGVDSDGRSGDSLGYFNGIYSVGTSPVALRSAGEAFIVVGEHNAEVTYVGITGALGVTSKLSAQAAENKGKLFDALVQSFVGASTYEAYLANDGFFNGTLEIGGHNWLVTIQRDSSNFEMYREDFRTGVVDCEDAWREGLYSAQSECLTELGSVWATEFPVSGLMLTPEVCTGYYDALGLTGLYSLAERVNRVDKTYIGDSIHYKAVFNTGVVAPKGVGPVFCKRVDLGDLCAEPSTSCSLNFTKLFGGPIVDFSLVQTVSGTFAPMLPDVVDEDPDVAGKYLTAAVTDLGKTSGFVGFGLPAEVESVLQATEVVTDLFGWGAESVQPMNLDASKYTVLGSVSMDPGYNFVRVKLSHRGFDSFAQLYLADDTAFSEVCDLGRYFASGEFSMD